jgi:hypothetical protein
VNKHVHKTIQHSSSYCINLLEYGAHICDLVLFALATVVYIRCCSASNATEYKTLIYSVAWNMKWYRLIVQYIKVCTVYFYLIYFHTSFKLFQPYNEQLDQIIVTSNSRNICFKLYSVFYVKQDSMLSFCFGGSHHSRSQVGHSI